MLNRWYFPALLCLPLSGCTPDKSPLSTQEQAFENLKSSLQNEYGETRTVARYCDSSGPSPVAVLCHAELVRYHAGEQQTIGTTVYNCGVQPGNPCRFLSTADRNGFSNAQAQASQGCTTPLRLDDVVDLGDSGQARLSLHQAGGTPGAEWENASFTLQDARIRLTEAQVNEALDKLVGRIGAVCRAVPASKTRVFLYPAGVTAGESANWIAKTDLNGARSVELNRRMLKDERADRYACINGDEPGISLDNGTKLPPVRQREILGTWVDMNPSITMSLERVKGKVYRVYRSAYCASGEQGDLLKTLAGGRYAVIDNRNGDYYKIKVNGDLGVFDRDGPIDVMLGHSALHPALKAH